jgi:hypothetical protein
MPQPTPPPAFTIAWLVAQPEHVQKAILDGLSLPEQAALRYHWPAWARPEQLEPAGEILVDGCRCPCSTPAERSLPRRITGRLEVWRAGKKVYDLAVDIGAGFTIVESDTESLRLAKWSPSPWNADFRRSDDLCRPGPPTDRGQKSAHPLRRRCD